MAQNEMRGTAVSRDAVIRKLRESIGRLKKMVPVDCVYLYGSYANGTPGPYSDVDVAVVSPAFGVNVIDETVRLMEVFEETGLPVEPRAFSRDEYRAAGPGSFLHDEVIAKGIRVA